MELSQAKQFVKVAAQKVHLHIKKDVSCVSRADLASVGEVL